MHSPHQDSDLETKSTQEYFYNQLDDDEEDKEEEFSFTCGGADASPITAEDAFINGQIKPMYPLFDRDLFETEYSLPTKPPVKKVFVEITEDGGELITSGAGTPDRKAVEVSPEACKKSNSTGFSKIWRFKEFLGRSNSDGRDAFVFLNEYPQAAESTVPATKVKKGKTASLSAHEVYLRSKAKDGERRRSYLPYRPELMGFFTNVNSGLSKNVHPY